jgi:hypothetical protein
MGGFHGTPDFKVAMMTREIHAEKNKGSAE